MLAIITARNTRRADDAATISIQPRFFAPACGEPHEAARTHEASFAARSNFVAIERTQHARVHNAIDVPDSVLAPPARDRHARVWAEIVEATACGCETDVTSGAAQPSRHRDVDERTQRAVDEQ